MSQEKIEIVRRIYERWGRGDFRAGVGLYDRYILFVLNPEFPDAGTYQRGRPGEPECDRRRGAARPSRCATTRCGRSGGRR